MGKKRVHSKRVRGGLPTKLSDGDMPPPTLELETNRERHVPVRWSALIRVRVNNQNDSGHRKCTDSDKNAEQKSYAPPKSFSERLRHLGTCPSAIPSQARTPQQAHRFRESLDQWIQAGRPQVKPPRETCAS